MADIAGALLGIGGLTSTLLVPSLWRMRRRTQQLNDDNAIVELYRPDKPDIDICFVHGLGGDRIQTWKWAAQGSEETNVWPADFLPQDAQADHVAVRILSYGYKSIAPTPEYLAQRTLYRHSQQLLSALAEARKDCPRRPLIFVGYSLGGVVIKSALIFSSQAKGPDHLTISVSTTGIVFLGTPHAGSMSRGERYTWQKTLANIIEQTKTGNPSLAKHLDRQSLSLQNRLQPFKALSDNISIVSYYEGKPTPVAGMIVPKPVNRRQPYGDRVDIIDADHANMCRFNSRDNRDYRKVRDEILSLCHEASKRAQENWERHATSKEEEMDSKRFMERIRSEEAEEQTLIDVDQDDFRFQADIPSRNPRFIGRVEEIDLLREELLEECPLPCPSTCAVVNLYGPRGIGKSEIAREFAYANRDKFSSIFWIPATSRHSIEQGLVNIARVLRRQPDSPSSITALRILADSSSDVELDENQLRSTISAVMEWFQSRENPKWLVVFDNLELAPDDSDIAKLIPNTTCVHGHCIITSREPVEWDFVTKHRIGPFSPDESISLLRASTGFSEFNERDLNDLSSALKYIPIALSTAASYISSTRITLQEYIRRLKLTSNAEKGNPPASLKHGLTKVEDVLRNTINNVPTSDKLQHNLSLRIFQVCCVLKMESVCLSIFLSSSFRHSCPGDSMAAIRDLGQHSLVALTEDGRYIVAQGIVLECGLRVFTDDQRRFASQLACESTLSVANSLQEVRDYKAVDNSFAESDIAAVMSRCHSFIKAYSPSSYEWAIDLDIMGRICEKQGRIRDAIVFYDLQVNRNKGTNSALRNTKMRLAMARRISGDNIRAEVLCEELANVDVGASSESTASILQDQFPSDETDIEALRLLKKIAHEESNSEEELDLSKQIAAIQEQRFGIMHLSTLEAVQELAKNLVEVGFYDEAEANIRRVLLSYENTAGASYVKTTESFEILASIRLKQGKYDDAEELFNRALCNHMARLGREHPTTQKCWSQLGQVYDMQGRYDHASKVYEKCLVILNATLGADHPDVLRIRGHKATNSALQNMHEEAEKDLRDILDRTEAYEDMDHDNVKRRTALQLVELLRQDPRADNEEWLEKRVHDLEVQYDLDLHRRIGWIY
ncbi:hypothetical protein F4818DRAFT_455273 [Hypoxylon cercidicola]|nr:hypothetical protein F4818DRAFT_455273 [Hypoxylon cercidicola]